MELKDKLLKLRKESHLSQQELANNLNVSRQSISKWELAETQPDINNIIALAEIYHVSTDYLLKDTVEVIEQSEDRSHIILIVSTVIILLGLLTGQMLWREFQNTISLLIGMIIQIVGIGIFECYTLNTHNMESQKPFLKINVWLITLLPIHYIIEYTIIYKLIFSKFLQPLLIGQIGILVSMFLPIIISICLSVIFFVLIRKYFK